MPGLLKQLQRHKPPAQKEERGAVLRSSRVEAASEAPSQDFLLNSGFTSRDDLTSDEPFFEEPRGKKAGSQANPTINSAIRALRPDIDSSPWWLTEEQKSSPQVESVVAAAIRFLDVERLAIADERTVKHLVQQALQRATEELKDVRMTRKNIEQAELEMISLVTSKGPLEALFEDSSVSDVFIDRHEHIRAIRRGHAVETPFRFASAEVYQLFVTSLLRREGRSLSAQHPVVDCILEDKWRTRVNVLDASLVEGDEPRICFRIPRVQPISFFDVLQTKTLPATVAAWMAELVALAEANILVVGPEGAGKTVMTTAMLSAVGSDERVITIEDVPEIFAPNIHLEKLIVRPGANETDRGVTESDLLRVAMRRSPHRIVVGEIHDEVSSLFLNALESGYSGSMATILGDTTDDAIWRLVDMIASHTHAPFDSIVRRVSRALNICVAMRKIDGQPCLDEICEIAPHPKGGFEALPLVRFAGVAKGRRQWQLQAKSSRWLYRLRQKGLNLMPGPNLLAAEEAFVADETEEE